jgi:hypothetical protein
MPAFNPSRFLPFRIGRIFVSAPARVPASAETARVPARPRFLLVLLRALSAWGA